MLEKLLDRFEHRVSVESILKSERPEAIPSDKGDDLSVPQTSEGSNQPVPQTSKKSNLSIAQASRSNFSSPQTSRGADDARTSPQLPSHKRGRLSPRQGSKFPKERREGSDYRGNKDRGNRESSSDKKYGSGVVAEGRGTVGTDGRGTVGAEGCGAVGEGSTGGEGRGEDMGKIVDSVVRGVTPNSGLGSIEPGPHTRELLIPFNEHHAAPTTMEGMSGKSTEVGLLAGRKSKQKVLKAFASGDNGEVGVVSEVKGEKYGVTYGNGKPKIVVTKKTAAEDKSVMNKNGVAMDTSTGRAKVGVIGEGRTKRRVIGAKQGANEKGEWSGTKKGSESDAEDLTNDQWDSSEEVDLLGEGESDEESDVDLTAMERDVSKDGAKDNNMDLEAEIEEGGAFVGSKGQRKESELESVGDQSGKATPLSPDQWQSGSNGADMWKPHSDLFPSSKKRAKYSSVLEGALASTQHPKYSLQGEIDERNFSLSHQNLLVGQLMSEHRSVCALAEELVNPRNDDVVSLKCLLESSKINSFHSYLPDGVVEQVLKDRGLVPSLRSLIGGKMQMDSESSNQTSKRHSKLLKIASASAESRKIASLAGDLGEDGDDPAIVHKITITPASDVAESAKVPPAAVMSKVPARDVSAVVDDPSIVSISSDSLPHALKSKPVTTSAAESTRTSGYDSEDPLPNGHVPSVFPSALPSTDGYSNKNLGDLFAAFSSEGVGGNGVSAKKSSVQEEFLTPPQSPVAALWEGCVVTNGGKNSGTMELDSGVSPTKLSAVSVKVSSETEGAKRSAEVAKTGRLSTSRKSHHKSATSHDQSVKLHDTVTDFKKLSVQELEQLMASSEEAYFSADSGDNAGSNLTEEAPFHSKNGLKSEFESSASGVEAEDNTLPTLEKWVWQKGPSSMESWSPGSNSAAADSATADSAIALPTSSDDANPSEATGDEKLTSGALGGMLEDDPGAQYSEAPVEPGADLVFLVECFPDLEEGYLEQLLLQNHENVEETVSMALLSTTAATSLSPLSGHAYFGYGYETQTSDESSKSVGEISANDFEVTANDEVLARALQEKLDHENRSSGVADEGVLHLDNSGLHLGRKDDEEIARILQEELDHSDTETKHDNVTLNDYGQPLGNNAGVRYLEEVTTVDAEDDNLVLKLTPSLARQLQNLFGPIQQHLSM